MIAQELLRRKIELRRIAFYARPGASSEKEVLYAMAEALGMERVEGEILDIAIYRGSLACIDPSRKYPANIPISLRIRFRHRHLLPFTRLNTRPNLYHRHCGCRGCAAHHPVRIRRRSLLRRVLREESPAVALQAACSGTFRACGQGGASVRIYVSVRGDIHRTNDWPDDVQYYGLGHGGVYWRGVWEARECCLGHVGK